MKTLDKMEEIFDNKDLLISTQMDYLILEIC